MVDKLPPRAQSFASLMTRIRIASKAVVRVADVCAAERDLSNAEMTLLSALSAVGDATVPDVARLRKLKRQSIQATADRLVERGFIKMVKNPSHAKSMLMRTTKQGKAAQRRVDQVAAKSMAEAAKSFKKADLDQAVKLLDDIAAKLESQHPSE